MNAERLARIVAMAFAVGLPALALVAKSIEPAAGPSIDIHGRMAETGGWTPAGIAATAGEPLRLRLTSDDVRHGFAVGQSDVPAVDVKPGEFTELTLTFDQPGRYTFFCTRWCGANHWRMRGTIDVVGPAGTPVPETPPLYVTLGLDIDAPHPADVIPERRPSAESGAALSVKIPAEYLALDAYRAYRPVEMWKAFRAASFTNGLSDQDVWDLVAWIWWSHTAPQTLEAGRRLYAANCAACHGEAGAGDGVMAAQIQATFDHPATAPADFTDAESMLGASPALLHGKIVRGGMGTGMPYWGPIFTGDQLWALVDYLWTFQFQAEQAQ
jgi:mono/diheme cytochrome c family protein/plastocyanin